MSYHDLSECTLTPTERLREAVEIINMIDKFGSPDEVKENEQSMMNTVVATDSCSVKQLFWLRDIKDRVL
jgi:hypothetical protein